MAIEIKNAIHASGAVSAGGFFIGGSGFTVKRPSPGVYILTLDQPINASACQVQLTRRGASPPGPDAARTYTTIHTSDAEKRIEVVNGAGTLVDSPFDVTIVRV